MLNNRTPSAIRSAWRAELESHLEADQTPVLHLGMDGNILSSSPALLALQSLATERVDITAPVALAGGVSSLWLATLLYGRGGDPPHGSPDMETIFTGSDVASDMASRTLYANGRHPLGTNAFLRPPADLPPGFMSRLAPTADPGIAPALETLPLYAPARAIEEQAGALTPNNARLAIESTGDPPVNWTAQIAILLAVILVLAAVVLSLQP